MASLEERLAAYIAHVLPEAENVRVGSLERIFGGASRETSRFELRYDEAGKAVTRQLILRRDPPGSLIETERAVEFAAYRAFHGTSVPVPEPLWLEEDPRWLDYPFFVMEQLVGLESNAQLIPTDQFSLVAEQKWRIQGEIARADPFSLGLDSIMDPVAPDRCWQRELGYWEERIDRDELCPQPVIRAAIRWLRRNPPPPAERICVVHGDYRSGNFLFDSDGRIHAILDWEMAHLGDPLEDLAWGINHVWSRDGLVGGLVTRADAIEIWRKASGLGVDRDALHWWDVFTSVKGQAIWVSSAKEFSDGKNQDLILGVAAWLMGNSQDRAVLTDLGHLP